MKQEVALVASAGVAKEEYCSPEFAKLEKERLWPRVWQMACREEELPNTGSFVTYDILNESVLLVRTDSGQIKAYNNACLHRGRRLASGCGLTLMLVCPFHGWKWSLDGANTSVADEHDWNHAIDRSELRLPEFKVGTWGGFVFVNFDPNCEALEEFLVPTQHHLDCLEFSKMRFRWYVTLRVEANWKTAIEAFTESYHTPQTHRQYARYYDERTPSHARGKHGQLTAPPDYTPQFRQGGPKGDMREFVMESIRQQAKDIKSIFTDRDYQAAARILTELPATASYQAAMGKAYEYMAIAAEATGAGFPKMTGQQALDAGFDWTYFPNMVTVHAATASLVFRARPSPDNNPDQCLFDAWSIERFTPGSEPPIERSYFEDWNDFKEVPRFLIDDFINMPEIQRGMKTSGFRASRLNPVQEKPISNLHRVLGGYIDRPP